MTHPEIRVKDFEPEPIAENSDDDNEDDEFEEVAVPSGADTGPSDPGSPDTTAQRDLHYGMSTPGDTTASVDDTLGLDDDEGDGDADDGDGVIRLEIGGETPEEKARRIALAMRKKPMTAKDRAIRLETHKLHSVALLANVRIRNRWCCNTLLQARLLSLLPHPLQAAFVIPPRRFPDRAQRSRLFLDALQSLVTWWSQSFFDISDVTLGQRTRTWDDVQEIVDQLPRLTKADFVSRTFLESLDASHASGSAGESSKSKHDKKAGKSGKGKAADPYAQLEAEVPAEKLRSVNSLMKRALLQEGSRDVSAQLFVALARACGLGTRLVASLQPVPWRAEKTVDSKKRRTGAGRGGRTVASRQGVGEVSDEDEEDEMEEVPIPIGEGSGSEKKSSVRAAGPRRLKDPADLYRLRKVKPAPQKVGAPPKPKPTRKEDLSEQPPVFWAEVFSRSDQRWIPVDPVRGTIRKKAHFEPASDNGPIRMLYVVAFEEDGFARDVTLRYTKNFGAKTSKLRPPVRKDEDDWWAEITTLLQRPYRLNRDDLEDAELEMSQVSEGMPLHMNGFKDHPIYVLERHLKREEVIQPKREIGRFKGEPVYRRAHVVACKTAEGWMRIGRRIRDKQEPLKWVKQRAVTIQKRRQQELATQEGQEVLQGLYGEYQTEVYRPPPIQNGVIPQNSFGNIDLYAPTMLPAGAAHLPWIAKVAKQLGVSYAEACTGFEFKKQRAIPTITGIVVAEENKDAVLEAYWASTAAAQERERVKREERALKRWAKLVNGLRVRLRLQAEYGTTDELQGQQHNPLSLREDGQALAAAQLQSQKTAASVIAAANQQNSRALAERMQSLSPADGEEDLMVVEELRTPHDESTSTRDDSKAAALPIKVDEEELVDSAATSAKKRGRPRRSAAAATKKRKADSDSENDTASPAKARRGAAPAPAPTRVTRSRAPKTEAQEAREQEMRERVKAALDSGEE